MNLGGTETTLLLREASDEPDLISPAQRLAEATVRAALKSTDVPDR